LDSDFQQAAAEQPIAEDRPDLTRLFE